MDATTIFLVIGSLSLFGTVFFFIVTSLLKKRDAELLVSVKQYFDQEKVEEAKTKALEEKLLNEKLSRTGQDLAGKKDEISLLIGEIRRELSLNQSELSKVKTDQVASFQTLKTALDEYKQVTLGIKESADSLKNLLSDNRLRGSYGEEMAENLLRSVGFISGEHYSANEAQDTRSTRPDFTLKLPDGTKVNIDVKFPWNALIKYQEATGESERASHLKQFALDVKEKIKQCASRDYINPEENTVDFVIMFVPNEMIFSLIYQEFREVWEEGMKKKVILAGPFSFTAILRMIFQSYTTFRYQKNLHHIIGLIGEFEKQYEKMSDKIDQLGKSLTTAQNHQQELATTRSNQLQRVIDRIRSEQSALEEGKGEMSLE
jgi:DNA recombination protein RmuC